MRVCFSTTTSNGVFAVAVLVGLGIAAGGRVCDVVYKKTVVRIGEFLGFVV